MVNLYLLNVFASTKKDLTCFQMNQMINQCLLIEALPQSLELQWRLSAHAETSDTFSSIAGVWNHMTQSYLIHTSWCLCISRRGSQRLGLHAKLRRDACLLSATVTFQEHEIHLNIPTKQSSFLMVVKYIEIEDLGTLERDDAKHTRAKSRQWQ